jgi:hypothetical protein
MTVTVRIAYDYFDPHCVQYRTLYELGQRFARSQVGMRYVANNHTLHGVKWLG